MSLLRRNWIAAVVGAILALLMFEGGQYWGRRKPKPVEWYSQLKGSYLIDEEYKCKNGRALGRVQVDLNLTNGKFRVIRNDPGKWPYCGD